ncbi:hypothetical protein FJZ23_02690 [Candidatus Parcubacteria bacterium]|nr:hypothetical protein [Candidatus Parcubacteria bacterium]
MKVEKSAVSEEPVSDEIARSKGRRLSIALAALGLFIVLTVLVYVLPPTHPLTRAISSAIPYPAAMVNGSVITMHDYINEYDALKKYLGSSAEAESVPAQAMQQTILDALVNKTAIRELAMRDGVRLDEDRVEAFYLDLLGTEGSEEAFAKQLTENFGWTTRQFKERILESIVIALQMSEFVLGDEALQADGRAQIENELASPGTVPAQEMGVYPVAELPEAWAAVGELPVGGRTGVIESELNYLILELSERSEAGGETQLRLKAVSVPKVTLEDIVKEYLDGAKVRYFVR